MVLLRSNDAASLNWVQSCLEGYRVLPVMRPDELLSKVVQHLPQAVLIDHSVYDEQRLQLRELSPHEFPLTSFSYIDRESRARKIVATEV